MTFRHFSLSVGLAAVCLAACGAAFGQVRLGPLFDQFPLTLDPGTRIEAAGPLLYHEKGESHFVMGMPPLMSLARDPELESTEFDFLYPLLTYDRFGQEYRVQLLQLLSFAGGAKQDESRVNRFTLFPFYFQQRGPEPADNYTALLPLYGTLKKRLFRDEISFVLWPAYVRTRKKDVVTDNFLYPFFSLREGDGLRGWKAWPLVSHEHKDVTTRTNDFGDVSTVPGHDKWTALWPFYYNAHTGLGTTNPMHSVGLLPLFALDRSPARDSTTVLWPFFNIIDDRAKQYREWQTPWPFIQFARGEGKTMSRVWPLYGTARNATLRNNFVAWPLYRYRSLVSEPLERERTQILFWLYSDSRESNTTSGQGRRQVAVWPLFTWRRDFNGNQRLQVLAPVEPILPNNKSIERDWSPLWSVWRSASNASTQAKSQSLLWNLYRKDATPDSKNVSLLFGLFQYDSDAEATGWRLFHIPVATHRKPGSTSR